MYDLRSPPHRRQIDQRLRDREHRLQFRSEHVICEGCALLDRRTLRLSHTVDYKLWHVQCFQVR